MRKTATTDLPELVKSYLIKNGVNAITEGDVRMLKSFLEGEKIRPIYDDVNCKYRRRIDTTEATCELLKKAGLPFQQGNDAPRGGQLGTYLVRI